MSKNGSNGKADIEIGTLVRMTDKMTRFVEEYLVDFNGTQAAIRAGYAESGARTEAWRLLTKADIRAAIQVKLDELTMSSAEAAMRLTRWGRGSIEPFLRITGDGEAKIDISTQEAQSSLDLIRKVKQTEQTVRTKDTEYTTVRTEIELHDAKDAVVQMAKLHGMFSGNGPGRTEPTHEDAAELWQKIRRIENVEQLERMLVAAAQSQGGNDES